MAAAGERDNHARPAPLGQLASTRRATRSKLGRQSGSAERRGASLKWRQLSACLL